MKLGFFDSGMGGLTVMKGCQERFPNHDYLYVGDTKNLPYGPKTVEEILSCMTPHLLFLLEEKNCDYVVLACNTASAQSLALFLSTYPHYSKKIINIVMVTENYFTHLDKKPEEVVVLATQRTVASGVYKGIAKKVYQVPMPGLVDLIEVGDDDSAMLMVQDALAYYPTMENLFLGCTHYISLAPELKKKYPSLNIIGQDTILIEYLSRILTKNTEGKVPAEYYVSGNPSSYSRRYHHTFVQIP